MWNKSIEMLGFRATLIIQEAEGAEVKQRAGAQKDGEQGAGDAGGRLSPDPHVGTPRLFPGAPYL